MLCDGLEGRDGGAYLRLQSLTAAENLEDEHLDIIHHLLRTGSSPDSVLGPGGSTVPGPLGNRDKLVM